MSLEHYVPNKNVKSFMGANFMKFSLGLYQPPSHVAYISETSRHSDIIIIMQRVLHNECPKSFASTSEPEDL